MTTNQLEEVSGKSCKTKPVNMLICTAAQALGQAVRDKLASEGPSSILFAHRLVSRALTVARAAGHENLLGAYVEQGTDGFQY